jgi:hypothetical protein
MSPGFLDNNQALDLPLKKSKIVQILFGASSFNPEFHRSMEKVLSINSLSL